MLLKKIKLEETFVGEPHSIVLNIVKLSGIDGLLKVLERSLTGYELTILKDKLDDKGY